MPLRYTFSLGPIQVAVWKIEEDEADLWENTPLSTADLEYLRRISHPRRRIESLAARAALAKLPPHPFHSLSHSFPWAAAAIAPHPIAIDLETRRHFPQKVQNYFTQPGEQELFLSKNKTFWHAWCAKEVAYKLLCQEFSEMSFKREMCFDGEQVVFSRGEVQRRIMLRFVETGEWLLAVGSFA
jgi:hypothetical protein